MAKKKMTVEEVRRYAMRHYNKGGDIIVECWTDKDVQNWIDQGGTKKDLDEMFDCCKEQERAACVNSGYDPELEKQEEEYGYEQEDESLGFYDEPYTPSATAGDYSPSCPWNAPGMSIHDFI